MEELLIKILEEATGLEVYNLERPESVRECIVYNYSDKPFSSCDDKEDITEYTIYLNLYCDRGLNKLKKQIKDALEENNFFKFSIPPANVNDELGMVNQAFQYIYLEAN